MGWFFSVVDGAGPSKTAADRRKLRAGRHRIESVPAPRNAATLLDYTQPPEAKNQRSCGEERLQSVRSTLEDMLARFCYCTLSVAVLITNWKYFQYNYAIFSQRMNGLHAPQKTLVLFTNFSLTG